MVICNICYLCATKMIIPAIFGITTVKRDCPERANLRIMRKETNLKQNDMTKNYS